MATERRTKPCPNCPFLRSAPLAYWHPDEYMMLSRMESVETRLGEASLFNCHKDQHLPQPSRQLCVGWMIDQKRKGIPSIALRIRLSRDDDTVDQLRAVSTEGELFNSVSDLVSANIARDMKIHPERYGRAPATTASQDVQLSMFDDESATDQERRKS